MQLLKFVPVAAAVLTLAACSSVNTKLVHDTVLPEYSPAANMGDVLDVWAACKKGTQKWTEIKEDGNPVVVQFECSAQDLLDLNNTILENSRTIKRMRELFEFDDIKYRAQFVVKSDGSGFDLGGQYNDYVWQDGKKTGHAIDTEKDKYTDGYKDDAFDVTEIMPWTEQVDGSFLRKVRKVCQYCGFSEEVEERKQPESTPSYTEPEAYPDYSETSAPTPTPTPTPVPAPDSDVAPKTGGNDGAAWVLALLAAGTAAFAMRKRARG